MKGEEGSELTLMPRPKAPALRETPPDVESFYHLRQGIDARPCCGTACFVARHLNSQRWNDAINSATRVYCLGKCYISPAAPEENARPRIEVYSRQAIVLERLVTGNARRIEDYIGTGGYRALEKAIGETRENTLQAVDQSQLRGRGGAAFPTGAKWRMAAREPSREKFIVANADEGDAGAYIDRFILDDDPHALIEGMALAAHGVNASHGYIYLRTEYPRAKAILEHAINEARRVGFLGNETTERSFDIEVVVGGGSYICGEETALLNSIEGKRPVPMARPPYATQHGLFGKPTVINNVETLATIPWIVRHGGEAYRNLGVFKSRGTKVVSLNSLFNRPGLYEIEFGISVRKIVEELGGGLKSGALKGVMIGGPLAGVIPPHLLETPFGFEELHAIGASVGHGGIVAFDGNTSIPDLIHYMFSFGAYESCGKCTPCRVGTRKIEKAFERLIEEGVKGLTEREWHELVTVLKMSSLCGHGIGLADFAESLSRHYGKELAACFK